MSSTQMSSTQHHVNMISLLMAVLVTVLMGRWVDDIVLVDVLVNGSMSNCWREGVDDCIGLSWWQSWWSWFACYHVQNKRSRKPRTINQLTVRQNTTRLYVKVSSSKVCHKFSAIKSSVVGDNGRYCQKCPSEWLNCDLLQENTQNRNQKKRTKRVISCWS